MGYYTDAERTELMSKSLEDAGLSIEEGDSFNDCGSKKVAGKHNTSLGKRDKKSALLFPALSDEYYSELLETMYTNLFIPHPKSDEEVALRLMAYLRNCHEHCLRPNFEGMSFAVGVDSDTWRAWARKATPDMPETSKYVLAKKSRQMMHVIESAQAMDNKMNPVLYIFRAKNYYGMSDQTEVVHKVEDPLGEKVNASELMEVINADVVDE